MASNTLQFQQEIRASIKSLETQVGQLASAVSRLEAQGSGKLPSHPINNPRESACTVTLRSGKQLVEASERARDDLEKNTAASSTECFGTKGNF